MFRLQRLTLDSSWFLSISNVPFILDPWLVGSEIDGFSWFNEQWHIKEPVAITQLPKSQFIVISQSYEDHCHLATLEKMDEALPLIATKNAYKKLRKHFPKREVLLIPENGTFLEYKGLKFTALRAPGWIGPFFYSLVVADADGRALFYSPHGLTLQPKHFQYLIGLNIHLLMTTFTDYRLPAVLGGVVNMGMKSAEHLFERLRPTYVLHTHDEKKRAAGLVARLAKVKYADYHQIKKEGRLNLLLCEDYEAVEC